MGKQNTKLIFEMMKLDNGFIVDPDSIFINGWIRSWQMLEDFLFKEEDSNLPELIENIESNKMYQVELEFWEDSDDNQRWLEFRVLNSSLAY